ncbi:MAG TPA: DbpA RNA binding domain-containing protein, partial [Lysobacter sp.]
DIPYDTESYVHRIGRTGRAGRKGEAILFVSPRERGMLRAIERATKQPIEPMELPSVEAVNDQRVTRFLDRISSALEDSDLGVFREMIERFEREKNVPAIEIAAALAKLVQGKNPLLMVAPPRATFSDSPRDSGPREHRGAATRKFVERDHAQREYPPAPPRPSETRAPREAPRSFDERNAPPAARHAERQFTPPVFTPPASTAPTSTRSAPARDSNIGESFFDDDAPAPAQTHAPSPRAPRERSADVGMQTFRIEVGHSHGVQPGNIVGAIANEADLESRYIGRIDIREDYTLVDLPEGMPPELMEHLKRVYVAGQPLRIRHAEAADSEGGRGGQRPHGHHADGDGRPPRGPRPPFAGKPPSHGAGPRKPGGFNKPFKPR